MELVAKIKGLVKDTDRHGNARYYFRRTGQPKIRIRSAYGSPEFREEVRCAELGIPFVAIDAPKPVAPRSPIAKAGSLKWLALEYVRRNKASWSDGYCDLVERVLTEICLGTSLSTSGAPNGDLTYAGMQLKHVAQLRDEKSALPHAANRRIKTLSAMFTWAAGAGLSKQNPAKDCPKVKTTGDGFHTWSLDEIAKYRARHAVGSKADLALRLFLMTGLRKSDVAKLGRQHVYQSPEGPRIRITPGKTKSSSRVVVDIPLLPSLAEALALVPKTQMTFLISARGEPHSPAMLGNLMREWCDQAELPHCSAHGLRKAGAVIAAEAGATSQQLQAIFGWTTSEQADHYTKAANRKKLATDGAKLLTMAPQVGQSTK